MWSGNMTMWSGNVTMWSGNEAEAEHSTTTCSLYPDQVAMNLGPAIIINNLY